MNDDDTFPLNEGNTSTIQGDEEITPFECVQCGKKFTKASGLNMHKLRVHSKTKMSSGYKWKQKGSNWRQERADRLEKRRAYQAALREKYRRSGRDSRGYLKKSPTAHKWSAEQRANFMDTVKWKKKLAGKPLQPPSKNKRIEIVYPLPGTPELQRTINFCPNCGEALTQWRKQ